MHVHVFSEKALVSDFVFTYDCVKVISFVHIWSYIALSIAYTYMNLYL